MESEYEFEAPQFVDFSTDIPTDTIDPNDADCWFDARDTSPLQNSDKNVKNNKRKQGTKPKHVTKDLTIPEPFQFHSSLKRFTENIDFEPKSPFVPLALRVKHFETKTPDRLKKNPGKHIIKDLNNLTFPKSPYLRTRFRTKQINPNTTEKEVAELQKIRPFKAKPVNGRILNQAPKLAKMKKMELTIPQSPAITKPKPSIQRPPSPDRIVKAIPIPCMKTFEPIIEHRVLTLPDFELPGETIRQKKLADIQEKLRLQQIESDAKKKFKARPLPLNTSNLPFVESRELTEPHPFDLMTEKRGFIHQAQLSEKLSKEKAMEISQKHFIANPLPDCEPFIPKKSEKPTTHSEDLNLKTFVRAHVRTLYDEMIKKKLQEEEIAKENMKREQMKRDKETVNKIRKEQVHKAQPVKHFSSVFVQPSGKAPTIPCSPMLGEKRRHLEKEKK